MKYTAKLLVLSIAMTVALCVMPAAAQPVVRLPSDTTTAYQPGVYPPQTPGLTAPLSTAPAPGVTPGLSAPAFDPYSATPGAASIPPSLTAPPAGYGTPLPPGAGPAPGTPPPYPGSLGSGLSTAPYGSTSGQPWGVYPPGNVPPGNVPPGNVPPGSVPPGTPPSLYPNGFGTGSLWDPKALAVPWGGTATRFLTPRIRYSWVDGGNAFDDLGINDFDFSVVAAFPNFLFSTQPLYVAPSFSLHLWQGPSGAAGDLPPNAYSGFLDFGWSTDPTKPISGEVGFRPGVFSDFNTFTTYSWRWMGQGFFRIQTTPATALRGGVIYIDRNDLKLLPAFGILWTPNPQTRFDIFFPHPKLAQHLTTVGNQDLWWYVGGEYGGGAWTVERAAGYSDRIDINDIRVTLGLEFGQSALLQQGRRTGFFEVGWVTSREVVYVINPAETSSLNDSFMLRAGWNY
ncbi:MAG: hypothetical protein MUF48_01095 [Pirellulaceae bacterium]|nr:hypothetical protein [Pirellulaceae bacterium]